MPVRAASHVDFALCLAAIMSGVHPNPQAAALTEPFAGLHGDDGETALRGPSKSRRCWRRSELGSAPGLARCTPSRRSASTDQHGAVRKRRGERRLPSTGSHQDRSRLRKNTLAPPPFGSPSRRQRFGYEKTESRNDLISKDFFSNWLRLAKTMIKDIIPIITL
jgi:hypothetical protein